MHRVVTVIGPKVAMFELSVACEVFGIDRSELVDPVVPPPGGGGRSRAPTAARRAS